MDKTLNGIIFDWGNVLGQFSHEKVHKKLAKYCPLAPEEIKSALTGPMQKHESGTLSPREFYTEVKQLLKLAMSYEAFLPVWRSCIIGDNPAIADVLRQLDPSLPICIFPNPDPVHWEESGGLPVVQRFFKKQRIVRSYGPQVRARKPDQKVFRAALSCIGVPPLQTHQVLFIDDVAENCDAFRKMGGRAHQYNLNTDPITTLTAELRRLGAMQ